MRSFWFFALILTLSTAAFAGIVPSTVGFTYFSNPSSLVTAAGDLYGSYNTITGVFTATSLLSGVYITNNGTPEIIPMTLVPVGTGGTGFNFDNEVFYPADSYGNHVDLDGLVFNVPTLGYVNLCATTGCAGDSNNGYTNLTNFAGYIPVIAVFGEPVSVTPEPSTLLTLGSGLIGLAGLARKRLFSTV